MNDRAYSLISIYAHVSKFYPNLLKEFLRFLCGKAGELSIHEINMYYNLKLDFNTSYNNTTLEQFISICDIFELNPKNILERINNSKFFFHSIINNYSEYLVEKNLFDKHNINTYFTKYVIPTECFFSKIITTFLSDFGYNIEKFSWVKTNIVTKKISNGECFEVFNSDISLCFKIISKHNFKPILLMFCPINGLLRFVVFNYDLIFSKKMTINKLGNWLIKQHNFEDEEIQHNTSGFIPQFENHTLFFGT